MNEEVEKSYLFKKSMEILQAIRAIKWECQDAASQNLLTKETLNYMM